MKKIPLTRGKVALVDDEDFEFLSQWSWLAYKTNGGDIWYAVRRERKNEIVGTRKNVCMHRVILSAPHDSYVDHIDRDGLNNQRDNLRLCTMSENKMNQKIRKDNRSGYKGVSKLKHGRFVARITINKKLLHLGTFDDPKAAAKAYDRMAVKSYGEFANLNFKSSLTPDE